MNTTLLNILNQIVDRYGIETLANPRRVKALLADFAAGEPRQQQNALIACIEQDFPAQLRNVPEDERGPTKTRLAEHLHREEGLDTALCADTLDLLGAALWGTVPVDMPSSRQPAAYTAVPPKPAPPPASSTPPPVFPPPPQPPQPTFTTASVLPPRKKRNILAAVVVIGLFLAAAIAVIIKENTYIGPPAKPPPAGSGYSGNSPAYNQKIVYGGYIEEDGRRYPVRIELTFENNSFKTGSIDYTKNDDGPLRLRGSFSDSTLILYEIDEAGDYIAIMRFESYRINHDTIQGFWRDMKQQDRILNIRLEKYRASS
jgi:hypothetical protein